MSAETQPPRLTRWLLKQVVPSEEREFFLGDLEEEYSARILPQHGPAAAKRWYRRQAVRSLLPLWTRRRRTRRRSFPKR